jgi:hypothetical protein
MRAIVMLCGICLIGACAFPEGAKYSGDRNAAYRTGSNLPRQGQPDTVDTEVISDTLRRGGSNAPKTMGGG